MNKQNYIAGRIDTLAADRGAIGVRVGVRIQGRTIPVSIRPSGLSGYFAWASVDDRPQFAWDASASIAFIKLANLLRTQLCDKTKKA